MFNWIKNLFTSSNTSEKIEATYDLEPPVLDTTTKWPFPTSDKPAANDPAPVTEAKPKAKTTKPKAEPKKKAAPTPTKAKKPAVIKTAVKATESAAKPTKRKTKAK